MGNPDVIDDSKNLTRIATLEAAVAVLQGFTTVVVKPVNSGDTTLVVTFGTAMADANYGVFARADWNTTIWLSAVATTGFTLSYGTAVPGPGHKVRYVVVGT